MAEVDAEIVKDGVLDVIWIRGDMRVLDRYRLVLIEGATAMAKLLGIKAWPPQIRPKPAWFSPAGFLMSATARSVICRAARG